MFFPDCRVKKNWVVSGTRTELTFRVPATALQAYKEFESQQPACLYKLSC